MSDEFCPEISEILWADLVSSGVQLVSRYVSIREEEELILGLKDWWADMLKFWEER